MACRKSKGKRFYHWLRLIKEEENFDSNKHGSVEDEKEEQGNWVSGSIGTEPGFIPEGGQSLKPKKNLWK